MEKRQKLLKVAGIPIGEIEIIELDDGSYWYGNINMWAPLQSNLRAQFESGAGEQLTGDASSEDR